jgi:isopentenyl diphosphate isomerase/L-lactate dehydrogenase-like FMN-dependent dehydrogenase
VPEPIVRLDDYEPIARAAMAPDAFDYVAGGSWDESTLADNVAAWRRRRFRPRVLIDVGSVSTAASLLGVPAAMPVATAPMAVHGLAHADAEAGTARGAATAGVPFTLSTMSTCSIEEVAAVAPDATRWFQLYTQADPAESKRLVQRAAAAGYSALLLTVDLPRLGYRDRDRRSGFELPELGNFRDTDGPNHRPDLPDEGFERLETQEHATLSWADLAEIRSWSDLPLVLKGILTAEDARLAVDHGVDAIIVSNHGARQLDRVPATADVLEEVVAAVDGRTEVWVDGGIRRGLDVVAALALGARGVLVGRPILYALAAGGADGVTQALGILREEIEIAIALLGVTSLADLRREHLVADPR